MLKWFTVLIVAVFISTATALPSFQLEITGNSATFDNPFFNFDNTSSAGEQITGLTVTVGDTSKNFDGSTNQTHNIGGFTLNSPDTNNGGGVRSNFVQYTFTGFDAGEFFNFQADLDPDSFDNPNQNFRTILFNNGGNPNSVVTVSFSNGEDLVLELPDGNTSDASYVFNQASAVPEPSSLILMLSMIGFLWIKSEKR